MKKLVVNFQNGTTGKEFFGCIGGKIDKEMPSLMEELDSFGTAYTVEDATYEEMVQSHAEDAKRNTEAWDRLYEGMTDEEKMGDMLKGNI